MLTVFRFLLLVLACLTACGGGGGKNPGQDAGLDAGPDAMVENSCQALEVGDIFVVESGPMKYALDLQGEAMYFPDDDVYGSWRSGEEGVVSVEQSCLDMIPIPSHYPGGVSVRPGSFLVRRVNDPQLYAVLPGNTVAPISDQVAAALYKPANPNGVNDEPMVIPDQLWPNLINRAPEIVEVRVHPGMLFVIDGGGETVYYADADGSIRVVTNAGFVANHFQSRFVRLVSLSAIAGMSSGSSISRRILGIDDPTQGG